jgi:hypothetical protein
VYNAYVGNPSGHYVFDLKKKLHRVAVKKISAISVSEALFVDQQGINTSQHGYHTSLRNTTLENVPVKATGEWFAQQCPHSGLSTNLLSSLSINLGK